MRAEGKAQKRAKTTFTSQKGPKVRQTWGERKEGMEREGEWWGRGKSTQPCLWEPRAGRSWAGVHGGEGRHSSRGRDRDMPRERATGSEPAPETKGPPRSSQA